MHRRPLLALPALLPLAREALAQESWPQRPVRIVVPFPPGGGTDLLARLVAQRLSELWGQPVVVENRAGANGILGTDVVAKARPDGHTLGFVIATHAINPLLYRNLPYDTDRDLMPVSLLAEYPFLLTLAQSFPANTLAEFIEVARRRPGELSYASSGNGSGPHLTTEMFAQAAGVQMLHVPYRGAGPANNDLLAGQVDLMFNNLLAAASLIRGSRLKVLAVSTPARSPALPEAPALSEVLPGVSATGWYSLVAPAGMPAPIVERVHSAAVQVMQDAELRQRLALDGAIPVASTPERFAAFIQEERQRWRRVIETAGIRLE
jgi:tripartite-type tricarboxylate transporter receptor subunit TctC